MKPQFPWYAALIACLGIHGRAAAGETVSAEHYVVYKEPGRFGGWPANHGIWAWGNELLVGFSRGYLKDLGERHNIDRQRPEEHLLGRSTDGGVHWTIENPSERGELIPEGRWLHGTPPPGLVPRQPTACPGGIDFTHPDFAMTVRMTDADGGPARFWTSTDRGHSWKGPFALPLFDQKGIAARTDYLVNGPSDCLLFLTASKHDGLEGRPLVARTTDGAKTWRLVALIGPEPSGYSIMPASARLGPRDLFVALRRREGSRHWIDAFRSHDDGQTWDPAPRPVEDTGNGNPPSVIKLPDGRLCVVYGYRAAPFEIRARISADGGNTWGKILTIRGGGGGIDIGYPRSVLRPDGRVVSVYYFHDQPKSERYIAATIWSPPPP